MHAKFRGLKQHFAIIFLHAIILKRGKKFFSESDGRFSTSGFFHESVSPGSMSIPGEKFTAGDNDAGDRVSGSGRSEKLLFWLEVVLPALGAQSVCLGCLWTRLFIK